MELKSFFEEGLANDLFMAQRHYFIFRTIGEHAHLINKFKDSNKAKNLAYLQSASENMVILSLSKIYDAQSKNKKYLVRSLQSLLHSEAFLSGEFPYELDYLDSFNELQKISGIPFQGNIIKSQEDLFEYLKSILDTELIKSKINDLKIIRDKYIVHNEHVDVNPKLQTFWEDVFVLQEVARLMLSVVGTIFLRSEYFQFSLLGTSKIHYSITSELFWVLKLLEEVVGKENINIWWEDT
ncbi:hypothetical protein [Rhodonellum sp.]|uniref:AbiU2 domain-containing protein n=1 Tax=Rhodonellum sp. TaxID=2231180 RepID=UPI002727D69D|nr:hypothetical protein [Rhodonellum sp.]MDO9553311.1 hypothetical protein [Rhodonellum sp.]